MANKVTLKASGLYLNSNSLGTVPPGALVNAVNIVIDKNDIIESRRGFKVYGDDLDGLAKQELNYKDTLLVHDGTKLKFDSSTDPGQLTTYQILKWLYASSLTSIGTTATFVSYKPHGLSNNDIIFISGSDDPNYSGTFTATVVNSTTFTYTMTGTAASPDTGDGLLEESQAHINQVDSNNKIRGVESYNSNFYFTSDNGILKLDEVNGFIRKAGGVDALDVDVTQGSIDNTGVLVQNSQLGYRILWNYTDANQNTISGAPSQRAVISLQVQDLLIPDFNNLLINIDNAATANTGASGPNPLAQTDYSSLTLPGTATALDLNTALQELASKLELDMKYTAAGSLGARYGRTGSISAISIASPTVITSTGHNLSNGDQITIVGSDSIPSVDGQFFISGVTANTFTINATVTTAGSSGTWTSGLAQEFPAPDNSDTAADYESQQAFFDAIVTDLLQEPTAKIDAAAQTAANFTTSSQARDVIITFTVPQNITTDYFYQVYRTGASVNSLTDPGDDMQLVFEANPTKADIVAGVITITDVTPDSFRGAALYTNPNQEGIGQADEAPPFAKDIAIFKNIAFYGNTQTLHQLQLALLGTNNLIGTDISIAGVTYTFGSSENISTGTIGVSTLGTPAQNVDSTARSMVRVINRFATNTQINAFYLSGPTDVPGQMLLETRDLQDPVFTVLESSASVGNTNFNPTIAPKSTIAAITVANPTQITTSARHGMSTGDKVAIVGSNSTPSVDGVYVVTVIDNLNFTIPVNVTVAGTSGSFVPVKSGQASDNEIKKNRLYYSKEQEFEAVPLLNFFDVGSGDKEILRVVPLRDSLFVLKTDGVYRITGDTTTNLSLSLFDASTNIVAADTAAVGNNQIHCLTDQGVVVISDTGISIISRSIENQLLPLVHNSNIPQTAFALFYQTDRKYILFMPLTSSDSVAETAWVYNNITNAWTQWDISKTCGVVNTGVDKLFLGASDINNIEIERKDFDRTDFADREYVHTVLSYDTNTKIVKLDSLLHIAIGDILVQEQTVSTPYLDYIISIESKVTAIVSTSDLTVQLDSLYDLLPGVLTQYKAFQCAVTWAPESLGDPGILKHFREATLRFKNSRITQPFLGFDTDLQQGTQEIALIGPGLGNWGMFNWGQVPWGGDLVQRGFRTYIPLGKQRCSIINCSFRQLAAREEWQIEGLTLTYEITSTRINK